MSEELLREVIMKYVPANLKSREEFIKRMMGGEVFYSDEGMVKMYYDTSYAKPFRFRNDAMDARFHHWEHCFKELPWYESIPEGGILCWVGYESYTDAAGLVVDYMEDFKNPFVLKTGVFVKYARPVRPDELEGGIRD